METTLVDVDARTEIVYPDKPEGPIAAAMLASGIGALVLGVLTTIAEASKSFADKLAFSDRVGPLSGKTTIAVGAWLVAWAILHIILHSRSYETVRALVITLVMIAAAVVLTFPTFFQLFGD